MKITNIPKTISFVCEIVSNMNEHTFATINAIIEENAINDFLQLAENRQKVQISANDGSLLFKGFVKDVTISGETFKTVAEILVVSNSWNMQESSTDRIFQNPKKTLKDILKSYSQVEIGICEGLNEPIEDILYQYNMDDFSFMQMLSNKYKCGLWITEEGNVQFGKTNSSVTMPTQPKDYASSIIDKSITATKDSREVTFLTMKQLLNGSTVVIDGQKYTIYHMETFEQYDEVYYRYKAKTSLSCDYIEEDSYPLFAMAEVTANNDSEKLGRVQVSFSNFEDNDSQRYWIPVLTNFVGSTHGGLVALPDVGDMVMVYIFGEKPYVIGSLRKEKLPDNCNNPDKKYFAIGKNILEMDSEHLLVSHSEKSTVEIDENTIVAKVGDNANVTIKQDSIVSSLKDSSIDMDSSKVSISQKNTQLKLESSNVDIKSGKSELVLNDGKTKLNGSSIDMSTQAKSI